MRPTERPMETEHTRKLSSRSATRRLAAGANPARWHRVFWAFALAVLPITLMVVGGLKAIQSTVLVVSLPLLVIGVLMTWSLIRTLRAEPPPETHSSPP